MEQSPSREANRFSASQEIPCILCNPKVHNRMKGPGIDSLGTFSVAPTDTTISPGVDLASENECQGFVVG